MNEKVLIITTRELKQQAFSLHLLDWKDENERVSAGNDSGGWKFITNGGFKNCECMLVIMINIS